MRDTPPTSLTRRAAAQVLLLGAAGLGAGVLLRRAAPVSDDISTNAIAREVIAGASPAIRPAGADLTLAVFTDYQCPACRRADPAMHAAAAADGRVAIALRQWPIFGPASDRAARVTIAARFQQIEGAVHAALMAARALDEEGLAQAVGGSGGDWQRLLADIAAHRGAIDSELADVRRQALGLGLPGTPSYLAGQRLVRGALSEREFARLFAEARESRV